MRLLSTSLIWLCCCSCGLAQIELTVIQAESSVTIDILETTDTSSITGGGQIILTPGSEPFSTAQISDLSLVLADGINIDLLGGFVAIQSNPGDVMIDLVMPGPPAAVDENGQFDQTGNQAQFEGTIELVDPFGLLGGSMEFDLSQFPPSPLDFNDVQITTDGQDLTISTGFEFSVETMFATLNATGTIVLAGEIDNVLPGDLNQDGMVTMMDVPLFVDLIISGNYDPAADLNQDQSVDLLDIAPFVQLLNVG